MTTLADLLSKEPDKTELRQAELDYSMEFRQCEKAGWVQRRAEWYAQCRADCVRATAEACAKLVCQTCASGTPPDYCNPNKDIGGGFGWYHTDNTPSGAGTMIWLCTAQPIRDALKEAIQ